MLEFCDKVGAIVKQKYGCEDGGDLCWTLIETGVIDMVKGPETAARIVAQHITQS